MRGLSQAEFFHSMRVLSYDVSMAALKDHNISDQWQRPGYIVHKNLFPNPVRVTHK